MQLIRTSVKKRTLVAAISALVLSGQAMSAVLEEVVVTAQKRTENIQDVPIAITAIGQADLDARGAVSLAEVSNFAPNVQLDQGAFLAGNSQVMTAYIRGIGQRDVASGLEPGVGVYVDGIFLSRSTGANVDLLDVERVEVLKGPQGTLFGRNTIGGAVSVITRRPSDEFGGKLRINAGSNNLIDIKGSIDVPISDSLRSQFSFSKVERDGYQDIVAFPGDPGNSDELFLVQQLGVSSLGDRSERGGLDNYSLRGKLEWDVTDRTLATLAVDYAESDEQAGAFSLADNGIVAGPTDTTYAAVYNACVALPPAVIAVSPLAFICGPRGTLAGPGTLPALADESFATRLPIAQGLYDTGDIDKTYGNGANFAEVESQGIALTLDHDFGWSTFKSITSFREIESITGNDIDGTPVLGATTIFKLDHEQWSQEFQLNVDALDGALRTVTGLYFFHEESETQETAFVAEGLGYFFGPYTTDVDSFAFYFNANYDVTNKFSLTFGARYTEDEKEYTVGQRDLNLSTINLGLSNPADFPTADLTLIAAPGTAKEKYDDISFRIGAEYDLTEDAMVYLSFSQGFKSGGIATRLSAPTAGNLPLTFEPETADTWELGIKSRLFDNSVQLNAALFTTEYDDLQITYSVGISPFFDNAGKATIEGVEIELEAQPFESLRLSASLGYLDASYDELDSNIINFTPISESNALVNVPEWSRSLSFDWDIFELANGQVTLHGDYLFKDEMARDSENTSFAISDSYEQFNANLRWQAFNEGISFSIWGKNLTDERYITSTSYVPAVGVPANSYNRPREYGVALNYSF